jgi:YggT family protein
MSQSFLQSLLTGFVSPIIGLLLIVLVIYMIFSWLIAFNVVNLRNPAMAQIFSIVERITEPMIRPLRKIIPPMGGLDLAFLVLFLLLAYLQKQVSFGGIIYNMLG